MRTILLILILSHAIPHVASATSYLAGPAPEVAIQEVITLALDSAKKHLHDAESYHIIDASYSYHGGNTRYWLVIFAKPADGHFFVGVYPDKRVVGNMRRTPSSGDKFVGPDGK